MNEPQSPSATSTPISIPSQPEAPRRPLRKTTGVFGDVTMRLLFELEMWVSCFGCFFRIENHPFSELERDELIHHDFSEELRIIRNATLRMNFLCTEISTQLGDADRLPMPRLADRLLAPPSLETALLTLSESLFDIRVVIEDLVRTTPTGFQTFASIGRILTRAVPHSRFREALRRRHARPNHFGVRVDRIQMLLRNISNEALRQDVERTLTEFFRLLQYLDYIQDDLRQDRPLKGSLLIFTLIRSETESLLEFLETRLLRVPDLAPDVSDTVDATIYALQMELRKVFGRELIGFIHLRQAPPIYAKVENAHGLLRDCFQQSLVSLAQAFDPTFDGSAAFDGFQTKLEQSLHLRNDIWRLLCHLRKFESRPEKNYVAPLLDQITLFRDTSLRYLMYKDWDEYEHFLEDAISARNIEELLKIVHVLSTFLETLLGQINMRAVLANHPFDFPPLDE
jgi:hypothetical protein